MAAERLSVGNGGGGGGGIGPFSSQGGGGNNGSPRDTFTSSFHADLKPPMIIIPSHKKPLKTAVINMAAAVAHNKSKKGALESKMVGNITDTMTNYLYSPDGGGEYLLNMGNTNNSFELNDAALINKRVLSNSPPQMNKPKLFEFPGEVITNAAAAVVG